MRNTNRDEAYQRSKAALNELGLEVDLMRPDSAFALRMPHEIKQAAIRIAKCHFYEWDDDRKLTVGAWGGGSINSALNALLRHGLRHLRPVLEYEIARAEADREPYVQMAQYLLNVSHAKGVRPADFAPGSAARALVDRVNSQETESPREFAFTRAEAMEELSMIDSQLEGLREVVEAIDAALAVPNR